MVIFTMYIYIVVFLSVQIEFALTEVLNCVDIQILSEAKETSFNSRYL